MHMHWVFCFVRRRMLLRSIRKESDDEAVEPAGEACESVPSPSRATARREAKEIPS